VVVNGELLPVAAFQFLLKEAEPQCMKLVVVVELAASE